MSTSAALQPEPQPIIACTISRDVQIFDLLIEDMEAALGENWGDLSFTDALAFLEQPEAGELQFVAIALDSEDEDDLSLIVDIIAAAKAKSVKVILIAEDLTPASLHQLLKFSIARSCWPGLHWTACQSPEGFIVLRVFIKKNRGDNSRPKPSYLQIPTTA